MSAPFPEQMLPSWRRAVLKVGSRLLAADTGGLTPQHALGLAQFVAASLAAGREVVIVSSGAVAAGRGVASSIGVLAAGRGMVPSAAVPLAARQALAALGQAQLMALWQRFFDRPLAQVLLTHDDLRNRRRYLNARATLNELLALGALPVVNENDTVSVDELKLGDNDHLAAIVAALIDADALFIATDIDGLYSADPRHTPDAQPLPDIARLTPDILAMAGSSSSGIGTGGMRSKLEAAAKAAAAGIETFLFNGREPDALRALARGQHIGTRIRAGQTRPAARKHWLRHMQVEPGTIWIDAGAARALRGNGASLLPGGVVAVDGDFRRGDMVAVRQHPAALPEHPAENAGNRAATSLARGLSQYSAADIRRIGGRHSRQIAAILGYSYGDTIIHRDDLVLAQALPQGDHWNE